MNDLENFQKLKAKWTLAMTSHRIYSPRILPTVWFTDASKHPNLRK